MACWIQAFLLTQPRILSSWRRLLRFTPRTLTTPALNLASALNLNVKIGNQMARFQEWV